MNAEEATSCRQYYDRALELYMRIPLGGCSADPLATIGMTRQRVEAAARHALIEAGLRAGYDYDLFTLLMNVSRRDNPGKELRSVLARQEAVFRARRHLGLFVSTLRALEARFTSDGLGVAHGSPRGTIQRALRRFPPSITFSYEHQNQN